MESAPQADQMLVPQPRGLRFHVPVERTTDWHWAGKSVTAFFNALSILFPRGETFFVESVDAFRSAAPKGSELEKAVVGFVGQESFHTREHEVLNEALDKSGVPATFLDSIIHGVLRGVQSLTSKTFCLAVTAGLEHLTAIMGHTLLTDKALLDNCEPHFSALWKWHALEEVEHKAVSFDLYTAVAGRGFGAYCRRVLAFAAANAIFWPLLAAYHVVVVTSSNGFFARGGLFDVVGWYTVLSMQWGRNGALRRVVPDFFSYLRPSFHPWDVNDAHFLALLPPVVDEAKGFKPAAKKTD